MDHSSRRRRLGLVAIAVAALATAATTAAPPSPDLSSGEKGSFTLTADSPVAWLDVAANVNEALTAAGGVTVVRVHAEAQARDQSVLLIAGDPTLPAAFSGEFDAVSGSVSCPVGKPCGSRVRLTAILLDPGDRDVVVDWTASAEANLPEKAASLPPTTLAVEVGSVQTLPATAVAVTRTDPATIELGPDVPRVTQRIHLTVPAGASVDSIVGPGVFLTTTPGPGSGLANIAVLQGEKILGRERLAGSLSPFADCDPGAPCEVDMDVQFDWYGGSGAGSTIDWSLLAWSGLVKGASPAPPGIVVSKPGAVAWKPTLTASTTGHTQMRPQGGAGFPLNVTLDMSNATGRPERVAGLIRLTLRANLAADSDPAARIRMSIPQSSGAQILGVGPSVVLYSRAVELVCTTQPICHADFSVGFSRENRDIPESTVDWTAEFEYVPLTADSTPKGSELVISGPPLVP